MKKIVQSIISNKKIVIRDIVATGILLLLCLIIELVGFQWGAVSNEKYERKLTFEEASEVIDGEDEVIYSYYLDGTYIRYLYLDFVGETDIPFMFTGFLRNGYGIEEEFNILDTGSYRLGKTAIELDGNITKLNICIKKADVERVTGITVANKVLFHYARFLLLFFAGTVLFLLVAHKEFFCSHFALLYFMISMGLGIVLILSAHHSFDSWDEQIHFKTAYTESWFGRYSEYSESAFANMEISIPTGDTFEEEQWVGDWLNQNANNVIHYFGKSFFIRYGQRAYVPQMIGLFIGRILPVSYTTMIFLGKFANLLFCSLVTAAAIHFTKYGKRALLCVGLLPTTLFQYSCFTYDGFLIALLLLGIALFLNEFFSKEKIKWIPCMVSIVAITVGCFPKAVYIPLLAVYWIMPIDKFYSKRQHILFKLMIGVLILLMLASFVMPLLTGVMGGATIEGDYRGGDTSQTSQFSMIFGYPFTYAGILLESIWKNLVTFFLGGEVLANFAYQGIHYGIGYMIVMLTMLFAFVTDFSMSEEQTERKLLGLKLWTAFLLFGVACLIWTALYLDFTPVGSLVINGVSPRYYLPIIFPLGILFMNKTVKCQMSVVNYQRLLAACMLIGSSETIYQLVMK